MIHTRSTMEDLPENSDDETGDCACQHSCEICTSAVSMVNTRRKVGFEYTNDVGLYW
jgi:hypothetical protein